MRFRILHISVFTIFILLQIGHFGNSPVPDVDVNKLDPSLQAILVQSGVSIQNAPATGIPQQVYRDENGAERYGVIIRTTDAMKLESAGIHLNSAFGDYATAKATPEELLFLASRKEVSYVDIPSMNVNKMNNSIPETGAGLVHSGFVNNTPYRGEGAIVLIYDSGIDWRHPAFRDPVDPTKSRILSIWDQTLTPVGEESNPAGFTYGVEYSNAEIEDELDSTPANFVRTVNSDGHGTHVAGIAAGTGTKFGGIAPDADIIIVKGGDGSFAEGDIIDGLTYAENKSNAFGKPIVVNLSLGGQDGPHDGTRAYEQAIDIFNGKPGQVAVVAAGNDGAELIHISGSLQTGGSVTFQLNVPAGYTPNIGNNNDEFLFSLWYDENTTVSATVTSPGNITYTRGNNQSGTAPNTSDGTIYLENSRVNGSKQNILLFVNDANAVNPPATGTWTLELSAASGSAIYDGWLARREVGEEKVNLLNGNTQKTVAMPGTADKAITVAAYVTKNSWPAIGNKQYGYVDDDANGDLANFSSIGPTRDNRLKPDISAPGKGIVAALSGDSNISDALIHPEGIYVLNQGTSMATPHVTGAAAIMLGIDPGLTADQIKSFFSDAAISDDFTGSVPNYTWGNGKLDLLNTISKQLTYAQKISREKLKYDNGPDGYYTKLYSSLRMGVRFKSDQAGKVAGFYLPLLSNSAQRVVYGNGYLNCGIYTDTNGKPGVQIGNTVQKSFSDLDPGTNNYINMNSANVALSENTFYHSVIWLSNGSDTLKVLLDSGDLNQVENPTVLYIQNNWYTFNERAGIPYNLQFETEIVTVTGPTGLESENINIVNTFQLYQNYPNPFNPATTIKYSLRQPGKVSLIIYDVVGRKVVTLIDGYQKSGVHEVNWQATNQQGYKIPSGIYFYHLRAEGEGVKTRKMVLLK